MLDKFEIGRNYRFSKEMWLEDMSGSFPEKLVDEMLKGWVGGIDGLKVTFNSEFDGYVGNYVISPEWCEEIIEKDERMLLDKFEDGKRYRFNKELFISYIDSKGWDDANGWDDDIHLQEVTILGNRDGKVWFYMISPEWCEEIIEGNDE